MKLLLLDLDDTLVDDRSAVQAAFGIDARDPARTLLQALDALRL